MNANAAALAALLNEKETGALLGWSPRTLQQRRVAGLPPAFVKIGRNVRYQREVINAFIAENVRHSTTETSE